MDFEQECVDGRCRCKAGLRTLTDEDKQAMYPDFVQCRNNSLSVGELVFFLSTGKRKYIKNMF